MRYEGKILRKSGQPTYRRVIVPEILGSKFKKVYRVPIFKDALAYFTAQSQPNSQGRNFRFQTQEFAWHCSTFTIAIALKHYAQIDLFSLRLPASGSIKQQALGRELSAGMLKQSKTRSIASMGGILMLLLLDASTAISYSASENAPASNLAAAKRLINEHRYKQADALLTTLIKATPDDATLRMCRGDLLRETGQIDEAAKEYADAAEIAPSDPNPLIALAEVSLKQLELDMSLSYAQQAVASDPSSLPARITLVNVLLQCEQTGEAERQLKYFPAFSKGKPEVELLWYRLSLKKGDYNSARDHLHNAIEATKDPGVQLRLEQSDLLQTMGDFVSARQELEKIIRDFPDSLPARLRLARLLETEFHDYAGALQSFNEALRLDPLSATAIAGRDRCQSKRKNIALQLKLTLKDLWARLNGEVPPEGSKSPQ